MSEEIITWDRFKSLITEFTAQNQNYFFRGHSNDSWSLRTSFHRAAIKNNITMQQYLDTIIPEIHYHISASHNHIIDLNNAIEYAAFLALIQHHGFPTPLLDWTLSPYIAAYFAFEGVKDLYPESEFVKIYAFDFYNWNNCFNQIHDLRNLNPHVSTLRPFSKFNPRIIHQQGVFTITNVDDIEDYLINCSVDRQFLRSVRLHVSQKPLVLRELNLMGINHMTLFPSIDGICRAFENHFFSASTIGPTFTEIMQSKFGPNPSLGGKPKPKRRRRRDNSNAMEE